MTLSECFARYGARGKNPRWSWSARSADGETVVLTLWADLIKRGPGGTIIYDNFDPDGGTWIERPGNRERLENLIHCRDQCEGRFRVVITKARDVKAVPRTIEDCFPREDIVMQISELNERTGEFRAASIPNA
jgi:hypothetical protein